MSLSVIKDEKASRVLSLSEYEAAVNGKNPREVFEHCMHGMSIKASHNGKPFSANIEKCLRLNFYVNSHLIMS